MKVVDFVLHIDKYMEIIIGNHAFLTYFILFGIIFIETGIVIFPFLPGDSVLFATGAIIAKTNALNSTVLLIILYLAAIIGDSTNYAIGRYLSTKIKERKKIRFIKMEYIDKTENFYEKYGSKAITFARFVPIVRTFAPFLAGVSEMEYKIFLFYNIIGGVIWVSLMYGLGFFFGNTAIVRDNFSLIILAFIIISLMPIIITIINNKIKNRNK